MTIKRLASAAAAAALLISCAGCGKSGAPDNAELTSSGQAADTAQSEAAVSESKHSTDYEGTVEKAAKLYQFSGVVYMAKDGEVVCCSAYDTSGDADTDAAKLTVDTPFLIGSLSKQFTAAAVMMLEEDGKLSVDDTLDLYFPDYVIGRDITIKDLLDMRSGIVDIYSAASDDEYADSESSAELPFEIYAEADAYDNKLAVTEWLFNQPLNFETNTNVEYSNSNYLLLAEIVEQVSGKDYHTFLSENIFAPLGMNSTTTIDETDTVYDLAPSEKELGAEAYPGVAYGSGDIISTAGDMGLWLAALRENKLISAESYKAMCTNYSPDAEGTGYGYGFMTDSERGAFHVGGIASYASFDHTDASNGIDIFAVTNDPDAMTDDILEFGTKLIETARK